VKIIRDEVNEPCEQWDVLEKEPETCGALCEDPEMPVFLWYSCTREDKHPPSHHAHTLRGCVAVWDDEVKETT